MINISNSAVQKIHTRKRNTYCSYNTMNNIESGKIMKAWQHAALPCRKITLNSTVPGLHTLYWIGR